MNGPRTATPPKVLPCWTPTRPADPAGEGSPPPREPIQGRAEHDLADDTETKVEVLGDSAYGTAKCWTVWRRPGGRPRSSRGRSDRRCRRIHIDDFAYDDEAGTLTCPNGVARTLTETGRGVRRHLPELPIAGQVHHLGVGPHRARPRHETLQRRHRQRAQDPAFQHTYRRNGPWSNAHRLADPRQPPGPLPRHRQEQCLAPPPVAALNLRRLLALGLVIENGGWRIG